MNLKLILLLSTFLMPTILMAQTVSNVTATQNGKSLLIDYDLESDEEVKVTLYISLDNGYSWAEILEGVSGDIGEDVGDGHKSIIWDVLSEREELHGSSIKFKVLAKSKFSIDPEEESEEIFMTVEQMPALPQCKDISDNNKREQCTQLEIIKTVQGNAKYSPIAKDAGIQGTVYVYFEVSKDGKVEKASVRRGVDKRLDEEALRAVNTLPRFEPGKQDGRPVRVQYTIPVKFIIRSTGQ